MPDPISFNTVLLHEKLARMKAGDRNAANELVMGVYQRMVRLSRKMFSRFPNVSRWTDCDDVLQNALLRLLKTLETVRPNSMRDFYNLAAVHLRRELLDLARFFARREKAGLRPDDPRDPEDSSVRSGPRDMRIDDPDELEKWCQFHEEVEKLPVQEREIVSLIYYHGWKQAEIARLFDIAERTVRRRWEAAMIHLKDTFITIE